MSLFKKNPFGHNLYIKKWLIRIFGWLTHRRFKGFNQLKIEGSKILNNLYVNILPYNKDRDFVAFVNDVNIAK